MKTIYLELEMGAAGDMLCAALYELLGDDDKKSFIDKINSCGIDGVTVEAVSCSKCGITGTKMKVMVDGKYEGDADHHAHDHEHDHEHEHEHHHDHGHEHDHHHHSGMDDIARVIDVLDISDTVKHDAKAVFNMIAEAESHVHDVPVNQIHFHEVGTKDAIADIVSFCLIKEMLGIEKISASYVVTGFGKVRCAHGILPVPAPATAYILRGIPVKPGRIEGEMCTPTGAAILKYFADFNRQDEVRRFDAVGYGMGERDHEAANCVRAFLYSEDSSDDTVVMLSCNIDDMTAEEIGYAVQKFLDEGALDVFTTSIGMKRSRPGTMISVICDRDDTDRFVLLMFKHTSTIGIRKSVHDRYKLSRTQETVETPLGKIDLKRSEGYRVFREKYEYLDIAAAASARDISFAEALRTIEGRDDDQRNTDKS